MHVINLILHFVSHEPFFINLWILSMKIVNIIFNL